MFRGGHTYVMGMRLALCQCESAVGDVGANLEKIMSVISRMTSDVYIFPELFLTGHGADYPSLSEDVQYAIDKMRLWCMEKDIAVLVGAPSYHSGGVRNSLLFITSDDAERYDQLCPEHYEMSDENDLACGGGAMLCSFRGMTFGLSVRCDIFFPEMYRNYALSGADINVCAASSATPSKPYFEKILPARSLENLIYTVFVNSVGRSGEAEFYGSSKLISPLGDTLCELGDKEEIVCAYVDKAVITKARKEKRHLGNRMAGARAITDSLL